MPRSSTTERRRRGWRRLAVGAALATAAASWALIAPTAEAAPGDPLATFGDQGVLALGVPSGCSPCPDATAEVLRWKLAAGSGLVVHGYEWVGEPPGFDPDTSTEATRPAAGAALAVSDGSSLTWHQALVPGAGEAIRLLAVGLQPDPAAVVAVVGISQAGPDGETGDAPLRQEVRRYTLGGAPLATTTLPVGSHGAWTIAAVAEDGTVVGVENGQTGPLDLPADTVRRYDAAGALRWTRALPVGDAVEDLDVAPNGRVLLAGSTARVADETYDGLVAALTDAGQLDAGFGTGGRIVSVARSQMARSFLAVDAVGDQAAVAGVEEWVPLDDDGDPEEGPGALLIARLAAAGLSPGFGAGGLVAEGWEPNLGERTIPTDVVLDGAAVVVAGSVVQPDADATTALLGRWTGTGARDDGFSVDGSVADAFAAVAPVAGGYVATGPTPFDVQEPTWAPVLRAYASGPGPTGRPATPSAPTVVAAGARSVTLSWATPAGGPAGYDVVVDAGLDGTVDLTSSVDGSPTAVGDLPAGRAWRFALRARNASGLSGRSAWSAPTVPPFRTLDAFIDRQVRDFAGRAPNSLELAVYRTVLADGSRTPASVISTLADTPTWSPKRAPIIRLYRAYFGRLPDPSGLDYWTRRYLAGGSLAKISSTFAASSEFVRKYGSLSNRAFVELVYVNVLGRPGERSGVDFWTRQLDQRRRSRGQTMLNFSESSEYVRKTGGLVEVVNLTTGMLRRIPTADEVALWGPIVVDRGRAPYIEHLLGSDAYDARIP